MGPIDIRLDDIGLHLGHLRTDPRRPVGESLIPFIYPFGQRIRAVARKAHTLAGVVSARPGGSSQLMLAGSTIPGGVIWLTSNFIAASALVALLFPVSFGQGILADAADVPFSQFTSDFRAPVLTDFAQVLAMLGAIFTIPVVFFAADGPAFSSGCRNGRPAGVG